MYKHILALIIIASFSNGQDNWYEGNLRKISETSININVNGLEDSMWEKKVMQISLLFLERFKLKINPDSFSPSIDIGITVINPGNNPLVSYNIDLSVYDFFVSKEETDRPRAD